MTFLDQLGATIDQDEVTLTPGPEHLNEHGSVHGGVLSSLLDACFGARARAGLDGDRTVVTVNLNVTYLSPAEPGKQLTATAEVSKQGDELMMLQGQITSEGQDVVVTASAVMAVTG